MSLKTDFLSIFPTPLQEMHLNPLTLMFKGQEEKIYWESRLNKELGQKRLGMAIGVILYLVFAFADLLVMPEVQGLTWFFRFAFFIPLTLLAFVVSYLNAGKKYLIPMTSVLLFVAGMGHVTILFNAPIEAVKLYHLGIVLFSIYGYMWMRSTFVITSLTLSTVWLGYFFFLFSSSSFLLSEKIAGALIALMGLLLSAGGGYWLDYAQRRNYYITQGRIHDQQEPRKKGKPGKVVEPVKQQEPPKPVVRTVESPVNKLFENLVDMVWFISLDGEIKYLSPSAKEFLGYEAEDLVGKRAITMMVSESYQDFEEKAQRLYRDKNRIQAIFDYKTKAGLVKQGDVVMRRFQDKKYGEGYIGSTRPVQEMPMIHFEEPAADKSRASDIEDKKAAGKAKNGKSAIDAAQEVEKVQIAMQQRINEEMSHSQQLKADYEDIKQVNRQLHLELDDMKTKFQLLHETLEKQEDVSVEVLAEVLERMAEHYTLATKRQLLDHDKELEIISDKFNHQAMNKSDLENYLKQAKTKVHQTVNGLELLKDRVKLYKSYLTPVEHLSVQKYAMRTILEEAVLKLKQFFKNTKHVIEIDCPKSIEISTDKQLFEQVINNMIMHSLQFSFQNIRNGRIEIIVEQVDQQVFLTYRDNGDKLESDVIDEMFAKMINQDMSQVEGLELHLVRKIIENHLAGSIGCDYDLQKNTFKVVIPIER